MNATWKVKAKLKIIFFQINDDVARMARVLFMRRNIFRCVKRFFAPLRTAAVAIQVAQFVCYDVRSRLTLAHFANYDLYIPVAALCLVLHHKIKISKRRDFVITFYVLV